MLDEVELVHYDILPIVAVCADCNGRRANGGIQSSIDNLDHQHSRVYFKARTLASAILEPYHVKAASGFEVFG
jgi:hypothetical protein